MPTEARRSADDFDAGERDQVPRDAGLESKMAREHASLASAGRSDLLTL